MNKEIINVLLADDDEDDRLLFGEAVGELPFAVKLTTVNDGEALMNHLANPAVKLPCVVFLDLNMPRKNGFECLKEIKQNELLKKLPVVVYSTSFEPGIADELFKNGAQHYLRKPSQFQQLKNLINQTLTEIEKSTGA